MATVQLPDGASLERTKRVLDAGQRDCRQDSRRRPGDRDRRRLGARQQRLARQCRRRLYRCSRTGASAARARTCCSLFQTSQPRVRRDQGGARHRACRRRRSRASACRRLRDAGGVARRQLRLRASCRASPTRWSKRRRRRRADCSGVTTLVPRQRAADHGRRRPRQGGDPAACSVGDVFYDARQTYLGSSYVNQFNKFGRTFQVYAQADAQFRLRARGHRAALRSATSRAAWCRSARWSKIEPSVGPSLITSTTSIPSATINGSAGDRASARARR